MRNRQATVLLLLVFVAAGCGQLAHLPNVVPWGVHAAATPTPAPTPTPTPSPSPTPTLVEAFQAAVMAPSLQAQGPVTGTITAQTIIGTQSGPITGTFQVKGADSSYSIGAKLLGTTQSVDYIVVGQWAFTRANGSDWSKSPASGKTVRSLIANLRLTDAGGETKFGRQLHHLTVANSSAVDLTAFGVAPGSKDNLTVGVSFWAESNGTPAGLSITAAFDQKVMGTTTHETVAMDVEIQSTSGITIQAPI